MSLALSTFPYAGVPLVQMSLAFGGVGSSYAPIGAAFGNPPVLVIIVSTFDKPVQFSWNGVSDHFPVLAGAAIVIDAKSDKFALSSAFVPSVKQISSAPASGNIYIGGFTV